MLLAEDNDTDELLRVPHGGKAPDEGLTLGAVRDREPGIGALPASRRFGQLQSIRRLDAQSRPAIEARRACRRISNPHNNQNTGIR